MLSCASRGRTQLSAAGRLLLPRIPAAGFAKRKGDDAGDDGGGGRDTTTQKLLKILESTPEENMPRLSAEEDALWKEATREYNALKMQQHRAWQTELSIKLQLKKAALAALPEELRAAAEKTQTELVPLNRQMWTLTPPVPGFQEQQQTAAQGGGRRRRPGGR